VQLGRVRMVPARALQHLAGPASGRDRILECQGARVAQGELEVAGPSGIGRGEAVQVLDGRAGRGEPKLRSGGLRTDSHESEQQERGGKMGPEREKPHESSIGAGRARGNPIHCRDRRRPPRPRPGRKGGSPTHDGLQVPASPQEGPQVAGQEEAQGQDGQEADALGSARPRLHRLAQEPSKRRTASCTRFPSARPATFPIAAFMIGPIAAGPVAPVSETAVRTISSSSESLMAAGR